MVLPEDKLKELELQITQLQQQQEVMKQALQELLLAIMASSPVQPVSMELKQSLNKLLAENSELGTLFNADAFWLRLDELCRDRL
ncbi:MAG: hypothetical protein J6582_06040 [Snodgrassella sp.]|jgi:hypothetical protein|uniref:Uncharacterized protein n=1 Tax=Snodgrassella alvi TaxID=1196083 RepID=A0A2N9XPE6_9NEIS|nr:MULTISPECIES: hypothetical protein [Snodgrassella]MCO6520586.1 hypothetical protein [Snodgrassella sp.]MCO6525501.1 hypothetical protein [Snodgrassella sp.]PIT50201.1 hypothetical protein BHC48_07285 [Snodgrassella communis]